VPLGKQIVGVRRQKLQQLTIFGHDRQIHDTLWQNPTVYPLREFDRAPQQPVNLLQTGVSGVGKCYAQQREIAVCLLVQRPNEPECEKFEELPVWLVGILQMADSQDCLILPPRDLNDESLICGLAITRQVFERFGDRWRRPSKVKEKADGPQVHLCRDVQSEELVIRLCRGQFKKPILASDRQADLIAR
jgi:hypothetical protein